MEKNRFIKFIILIALVLVCYYPSVHGGFIWDDLDYIADNAALHSLDGLKEIWLSPQASANYYPLFFTNLWLQYQLWGENVLGYHIVTILFHIFNALLIWYLLDRLKIAGAFVTALLFAIHPVNVESVAWICELKNTQSTFFMLLSILFFHMWLKMDGISTRAKPFLNKRTALYLLTLLAYICALTTKTVTIVLCVVYLIVIWMKHIKFNWSHVLMLVPFVLLGVPLVIVFIRSDQNYVMLTNTRVVFSDWEQILIAGRAFWFYPLKMLWPEPLMFFYPKWEIDPTSLVQWLYPLSALLVSFLVAVKRNAMPRGFVAAFLFYCMTIAPVLGLINMQNLRLAYVADHFVYLPSIVLIPLFLNVVIYAQQKWQRSFFVIKPALMTLLLIYLGALSWKHAGNFKDRVSIYSDTIRKDPKNEFTYNLRGRAYVKEERYDLALSDFSQALRIRPGYFQALNNRAVVYTKFGQYKKALCDLDTVMELNPDDQRAIRLKRILINKHRSIVD